MDNFKEIPFVFGNNYSCSKNNLYFGKNSPLTYKAFTYLIK